METNDGSSECSDKNACRARGKTKFGASKLFEPTLEEVTPEPPLLALSCAASAAGFCGWHHVLLPYCSQDWWSGRTARPAKRTWGRHFAGHEILRAALDALGSTPGPTGGSLGDAAEVLLVGAGAGGHGVWANADFLAARLPRARVSALVLNAFHAPCHVTPAYAGSGRVALQPAADWSCAALAQRAAVWDAHVDPECAAAQAAAGGSKGLCLLGGTAAPHVSTRVFVAQAQFDRAVLEAHFGMPASVTASTAGPGAKAPPGAAAFLAAWRKSLGAALTAAGGAAAGHGVFAPTCMTGLSASSAHGHPRVGGKDFPTALAEWYAAPPKRGGTRSLVLVEQCEGKAAPLACNQAC